MGNFIDKTEDKKSDVESADLKTKLKTKALAQKTVEEISPAKLIRKKEHEEVVTERVEAKQPKSKAIKVSPKVTVKTEDEEAIDKAKPKIEELERDEAILESQAKPTPIKKQTKKADQHVKFSLTAVDVQEEHKIDQDVQIKKEKIEIEKKEKQKEKAESSVIPKKSIVKKRSLEKVSVKQELIDESTFKKEADILSPTSQIQELKERHKAQKKFIEEQKEKKVRKQRSFEEVPSDGEIPTLPVEDETAPSDKRDSFSMKKVSFKKEPVEIKRESSKERIQGVSTQLKTSQKIDDSKQTVKIETVEKDEEIDVKEKAESKKRDITKAIQKLSVNKVETETTEDVFSDDTSSVSEIRKTIMKTESQESLVKTKKLGKKISWNENVSVSSDVFKDIRMEEAPSIPKPLFIKLDDDDVFLEQSLVTKLRPVQREKLKSTETFEEKMARIEVTAMRKAKVFTPESFTATIIEDEKLTKPAIITRIRKFSSFSE